MGTRSVREHASRATDAFDTQRNKMKERALTYCFHIQQLFNMAAFRQNFLGYFLPSF